MSYGNMTHEELGNTWYKNATRQVSDQHFKDWDTFLVSLIDKFNSHTNNPLVQDIVIRALERRDEISKDFILDHLLGELGLFPYITTDLSSKDKLRRVIFTTPQDEDMVFHIRQAEVFHRIMNGENIILSAPTSFGKSLIIEALVSSKVFNNIVIVVPTIALIDELKKKLFKYNDFYKIITQVNQSSNERNIYIFTQERVLEYAEDLSVDFFIIDEFYKLAPNSNNDERCDRLNLALKKLYSKCNRFYMLGPNINDLTSGIVDELRCSFLKFDSYITVATNKRYYPLTLSGNDTVKDVERDAILYKIIESLDPNEQTVIYCKSPKRTSLLMRKLLDSSLLSRIHSNDSLSTWLSENFHSEWSLVDGLKHGIAYHHGQIPRAIGAKIIELFNKSRINILVCTSTLIEGVNTNAKNIIIYDDCITGRTKLDMFTFNNIAGRSGRMFEHFVGEVFILGGSPQEELPLVDIPVITQSENASESLLLHMGDEINEMNKARVKKFYDQDTISTTLIMKHQGIDPNKLIEFAKDLVINRLKWNPIMKWDGAYPSSPELRHLVKILFEYFTISRMGGGSVVSKEQLHVKLNQIIHQESDKDLIHSDFKYWYSRNPDYPADDSVHRIFNFKKNVVNYNLPKIIYAISDIQEEVFKRYGFKFGDYKLFASKLENFYQPSAINSLEEFGIPSQISKKLLSNIEFEDVENIDSVIEKLTKINNSSLYFLTDIETDFVQKAISYM